MSGRRVALVTGGTKGIGRAIAIGLAAKDYDVALNFASSTRDLEITKEEIAKLGKGTKVIGVQADLGVAAEATRVIDEVVKEFGKIDCLVNNAGIAIYKSMLDATAEDVDRSHAINYRAPFLLSKAAIPHIRKGGSIIFISSSLTINSGILPTYQVYVPTKGAVEQMARVLAKTLGNEKFQIRVNVVSPGPTGTDLFYEGKSEEFLKTIASLSPFDRLGKPEEIAEGVVFLATSASWVSGQNLRINGATYV